MNLQVAVSGHPLQDEQGAQEAECISAQAVSGHPLQDEQVALNGT